MFKKPIIAVLRGGPSSEFEVSLNSGKTVLKNLPEKYEPLDVFIDREGNWHVGGIRKNPKQISKLASFFFNAMHGEYGEDGQVQEILDDLGVRYNGSGNFTSRLAMNKALAKKFLEKEGIRVARHLLVQKNKWGEDVADEIFKTFSFPVIVKPLSRGSSVGVYIAKNFYELEDALEKSLGFDDFVLVEEFIKGREATGTVLNNWRGKKTHALPVIEIVPANESGFFDYDAKYNGESEEICPGRFSEEESRKIKELSAKVHDILGLRHYSRSDFIVPSDGKPVFLEVNTLPGLTEASLLPKALKAEGISLSEFLEHVIEDNK